MEKYNKAEIMKAAWGFVRRGMDLSEALKTSWKHAKSLAKKNAKKAKQAAKSSKPAKKEFKSIDVKVEIISESAKAIKVALVTDKDYANMDQSIIWFPKSQIDYRRSCEFITIPTWLAESKLKELGATCFMNEQYNESTGNYEMIAA
jgi:hypothetical protein